MHNRVANAELPARAFGVSLQASGRGKLPGLEGWQVETLNRDARRESSRNRNYGPPKLQPRRTARASKRLIPKLSPEREGKDSNVGRSQKSSFLILGYKTVQTDVILDGTFRYLAFYLRLQIPTAADVQEESLPPQLREVAIRWLLSSQCSLCALLGAPRKAR